MLIKIIDTKDMPERVKELHLSDAFDMPVEQGKFEWTATLININTGMNPELLKKCKALGGYVTFVDKVRNIVLLIEEHIIGNHGGKVSMVCGLSMGGLIAAKLAAKGSIEIETLVLDGAPLIKVPGIAARIMQSTYLSIIRRSKKREPKIIKSFKKTFLPEKHLDSYLKIADNMTDESIRNMIGSVCKGFDFVSYSPDMKILFMHGTKGNESISEKAAKKLKKMNPQTKIRCYKNYAHAQLACFEPHNWINDVTDFKDSVF